MNSELIRIATCLCVYSSMYMPFSPFSYFCKYYLSGALHFENPHPCEKNLKAVAATWIATYVLLLRQNNSVSVHSLQTQSKQSKLDAISLVCRLLWFLLGDGYLVNFHLCKGVVTWLS